jgi:hypothetical protein
MKRAQVVALKPVVQKELAGALVGGAAAAFVGGLLAVQSEAFENPHLFGPGGDHAYAAAMQMVDAINRMSILIALPAFAFAAAEYSKLNSERFCQQLNEKSMQEALIQAGLSAEDVEDGMCIQYHDPKGEMCWVCA